MSFQYDYGFMRTHPTIWEKLGADLSNGRHKAVAFNESGEIVLATNGEDAVGIILSSLSPEAKLGDDVEVLVKDIGLLEVGEPVKKGDSLTINEEGLGVIATEGQVVFARALTVGGSANATVEVCLK